MHIYAHNYYFICKKTCSLLYITDSSLHFWTSNYWKTTAVNLSKIYIMVKSANDYEDENYKFLEGRVHDNHIWPRSSIVPPLLSLLSYAGVSVLQLGLCGTPEHGISWERSRHSPGSVRLQPCERGLLREVSDMWVCCNVTWRNYNYWNIWVKLIYTENRLLMAEKINLAMEKRSNSRLLYADDIHAFHQQAKQFGSIQTNSKIFHMLMPFLLTIFNLITWPRLCENSKDVNCCWVILNPPHCYTEWTLLKYTDDW